jgi:HAD superfamily hydrolase (TIGR01509 family)
MIKLIAFDLDGVLVDSRELHYQALNMTLEEIEPSMVINRDEHLSTYDGRTTTEKLLLLTKHKGLKEDRYQEIWKSKQEKTAILIQEMTHDEQKIDMLKTLKEKGYIIHVCSNSIKHSVKLMLLRKGLIEYVDEMLSNQDVQNPKPSPEMYMRSMLKAEVSPRETLVVEDSHVGRKAALESGAFLHAVRNQDDVHLEAILQDIRSIETNDQSIKPKWQGGKMNVLIPMAGAGSRFEKAGYTFPKPLIDVNGKPMIQVVVDNLNIDAKHIFIVQKSHYEQYNLKNVLSSIVKNCDIIQVDGVTEGAACTTLLAKELINNDEPLLMANSDQFIEWDSNKFMYSMIADTIDAGILTFESTHPKWSYAKLNDDGFVSEVAEKNPISKHATVGVYYWNKGSDYVKYAEQMINKNTRVNNEFYVCPVFNEAVEDGKRIKTYDIDKMWGLGTPEDLETFNKYHKE